MAISAPLHVFFLDTVNIRSGVELTYTPELTRVGQPMRQADRDAGAPRAGPDTSATPPVLNCDRPGPGYNKDRGCWDTRALPVAPARVTVPAGTSPLPSPVVLAVKVNADGTTAEVAMFRPSESAEFNDLASRYALTMRWTPAKKAGVPVVGWTQIRLEPVLP